jgi:transposase InsO family protein
MKDMYSVAGISKQALWKHNQREDLVFSRSSEVVSLIKQARRKHRRMGCRTIFYKTKGKASVGRDIFEQIGFANGFRLKRKRNARKTTWGQRIEIYPNLIEGTILNNINQAWQSDIFYIDIEGITYYGVTILDVYSRRLLALHLSRSLAAPQLIVALKKALRDRAGHDLTKCILHSDRGSQYISESYKDLVRSKGMRLSMAKLPQENAYVERVQGTLKNDYLYANELKINNIKQQIIKYVNLYNNERPHSALGMRTPQEFELFITGLPEDKRPKMSIFQWDHELLTKESLINRKKKEEGK